MSGNKLLGFDSSINWLWTFIPGQLMYVDNYYGLSNYKYVSTGALDVHATYTSIVNIPHGLSYTPDVTDFEFEFIGPKGNITSISVSNIDSDSFNVSVSPQPGEAVVLYWRIKNNYINY